MDFNDTPEEAGFRAEARRWLDANAPAYRLPDDPLPLEALALRGRAWQKAKAAGGFGAISLPPALGGRSATPMMEVIFGEEELRHRVPVGVFTSIGVNLVVPTLLSQGTPAQIDRFVRPTIEGEIQWCQLFSEPAAGSDLAGIRTRAVRDGDHWVITGQKVWNSWAQVADWGVLIARTDPGVPKHKGMSYFLIDMRQPGVEVRPIRQISGESEFNEVFLTELRVPDSGRVGAAGAGWKVAMVTLMNERLAAVNDTHHLPDGQALLAAWKSAGGSGSKLALARLLAREQALKHFRSRLLTEISRGETPGLAAMTKLVYGRMLQELSAASLDLLGLHALYPPAQQQGDMHRLQHGYWWGAAMRIAGGTDEVLRNQLAERMLGLPADLRVDKELPFNQLPTGR